MLSRVFGLLTRWLDRGHEHIRWLLDRTLFGLVRHRSPSFRMPLDLRRWTPANDREPTADG